ncbi:MAG: YafY family transcriptional regulator [Kouleothrix sp.]|jgi:predicted DNA-binding transcriptional regulator YafY|nr:YafY family transcriptional regulator [Kouleothrix sp.]
MNRTDRLLAIVLELQARGRQRAEDLAATFEVGKRTIYRDIQALCDAGVPVVSTPGQGYSLSEGYFLPPLRFTADEALMLLLGGDVMCQSFDAEYRAAALAAGRKIAGALPEHLRGEVAALRESIRFVAHGTSVRETELLRTLRRALVGRHVIHFRYHTRSGQAAAGAWSQRTANPLGLVYVAQAWHLIGFDHARQDRRNFRVDRIEQLRVLAESFERPASLRLELPRNDRQLIVRVLFSHAVADWVREAPSFFAVAEEAHTDGLLITLGVRHERDILGWLLSWGRDVRVLEPDSLRALVAEEAAQIARNHESLLT